MFSLYRMLTKNEEACCSKMRWGKMGNLVPKPEISKCSDAEVVDDCQGCGQRIIED